MHSASFWFLSGAVTTPFKKVVHCISSVASHLTVGWSSKEQKEITLQNVTCQVVTTAKYLRQWLVSQAPSTFRGCPCHHGCGFGTLASALTVRGAISVRCISQWGSPQNLWAAEADGRDFDAAGDATRCSGFWA